MKILFTAVCRQSVKKSNIKLHPLRPALMRAGPTRSRKGNSRQVKAQDVRPPTCLHSGKNEESRGKTKRVPFEMLGSIEASCHEHVSFYDSLPRGNSDLSSSYMLSFCV